jgi:polysaccharide biosynthesis/export protein PslD
MIGMGASIEGWGRCRGRVLVAQGVSLLAVVLISVTLTGCMAGKREAVAPLPPLSVAPSRTAEEVGPEYWLSPGDVVRVKYLYSPELDQRLAVQPDGNIIVPEAGTVRAEGRTTNEVAQDVQRAASERLREPVVTVIVEEIAQRKVYVGGEVRNPGFVFYREGMTPLQAIFDRGGFTDVARSDSVLKISGTEATRLDLSKAIRRGEPELSTLVASDVLYVPRTFIGDANSFVKLYIHNLLPITPRAGVGFAP